jgi:phenylpropionate dioxygenase-like ring-hydroxylating dioxygenase large terminal subunit
VRGKAGEIDVLSNVCIHRNFPVARGRGNCRLFKCQYHQWIYNLDGTLRGAALMGQAEDFRIHDWRLHAFRTKVWHGWIFVNLDPVAPPLAPQLTGLDDLFRRHQSETYQYINLGSYDLPVNWKCVVDIFAENYHTSGVHETSLKDSVPSSKTLIDNTDGHPYCVFRLPSGSGDALTNPDEYLLSGGFAVPKTLAPNDLTHAIGGIVYPTFSWYFNPDLFFYVEIHPQRHNRTTGRYGVAVIREALDDPQFAAKLEQYRKNSQIIVDEDLWAIGEMQRGKRSAFATQGRTSHIEGTLWHFHKWYVERLQAAAPELFA